MRKLLLAVSYDGTDFHGWQRQVDKRTVQQELEEQLSALNGKPTIVIGASRTDAGVHAFDQQAVFKTAINIPAERVPLALNSKLPSDIIIKSCREVDLDFHPRYHATGKLYSYTINNTLVNDFRRSRFSWYLPRNLDLEAMRQAANYFVGQHDFAAFCAAGSQVNSTIREIYSLTLKQDHDGYLVINYHGNGFLYKMVRIITGTLVDIGRGKFAPSHAAAALASLDRRMAMHTAPPMGLCLEKVYFDTKR